MLPARLASRGLGAALYVTIGLSGVAGLCAAGDAFLGTTYWPDDAEYGLNLLVFAWILYLMLPEDDDVERWELIAVPSLVGSVWLMVVAAYTNPESILTILSIFLLFIGLAFGLGGKYQQWANPEASG